MHSSILPTGQREPEVGDERLLERARDVLRIEAQAVLELVDTIDGDFARACRLILACQGRVVVSGIGKSGHVARKIAATLAFELARSLP